VLHIEPHFAIRSFIVAATLILVLTPMLRHGRDLRARLATIGNFLHHGDCSASIAEIANKTHNAAYRLTRIASSESCTWLAVTTVARGGRTISVRQSSRAEPRAALYPNQNVR
jgi:hypothetical protein